MSIEESTVLPALQPESSDLTHRDVYIHSMEMPGTKRDGKMAVKGMRIYMSHPAAKRLADVLGEIM